MAGRAGKEPVLLTLSPTLLNHSELFNRVIADAHIVVVLLSALIDISGEHTKIHQQQQGKGKHPKYS